MSELYIEKKSNSNYIIRVNTTRNTFMVFKDNSPVKNLKIKSNSIVHELPQVIFLGKEFDLKAIYQDRIGFFDVQSNQIYIPFWVKGVSDVRHVKLPAYIESDMLPVCVYHFNTFHFGSIPISLSGMNYFVVDTRVDREILIRLKMHFPMSRIVVYRGEKDTLLGKNTVDNYANVRAVDIEQKADVGFLSNNPAYAARLYLRKLDFEKFETILYKFKLDLNLVLTILSFLHILKERANVSSDLTLQINNINHFVGILTFMQTVFKNDVRFLEQRWEEYNFDVVMSQKLLSFIQAQKNFYHDLDKDNELFIALDKTIQFLVLKNS